MPMRMNTLVMVMRTPSRAIGGRYTGGAQVQALIRTLPFAPALETHRDQRDRPRAMGHTGVIAVQDDHTRLV
jgi:hypothetical protein